MWARCLAFRNNLDDDNALHHCCDHTEALIEHFPLDKLWNEYGIVGELVPFTNDFPSADIYELIAPDLLHQIIKGTFKDHLVEWVEKYLSHVHGDACASVILDNIDRWYVPQCSINPQDWCEDFQDCHRAILPRSVPFSTGLSFQAVDRWWLKGIDEGVSLLLLQGILTLKWAFFGILARHWRPSPSRSR